MSALLIRVPVTRTLIAPILTVLIAVLVNRGLLRMEQFVKVSKTYGHKKHIMHDFNGNFPPFLSLLYFDFLGRRKSKPLI